MKKLVKMGLAALVSIVASACGADPSIGNSVATCESGDCGTPTENSQPFQTLDGTKNGALIIGGTCTADLDDAPCIDAYNIGAANGVYDNACLALNPKPQCGQSAATGLWGCYVLTSDTCPQTTGCTTDAQCNDGNTCTTDACKVDGSCLHTPTIGAVCSDANACTTGDTCSALGVCGGTPVSNPDTLYCNGVETCEPATGNWLAGTPVNCGADPDLCDGTMTCSEADLGVCVNVAAPVAPADDGNPCTTPAVCDPATGIYATSPEIDGTLCDALTCSTQDTCQSGVCKPTLGGYTGGDAFCAGKVVDQLACMVPWDYCDPLGDYAALTDTFKDADGCVWTYKVDGAPCDGQGSGWTCQRGGTLVPVCTAPAPI